MTSSTKAKLDLNKGKTNFTNDFSPYHTTLVKSEFNTNYRNWIVGGGAVAWSARSPDHNSMDYFMWDFLKNKVYATQVQSKQDLLDRTVDACISMREKLTFIFSKKWIEMRNVRAFEWIIIFTFKV